MKKLLAGIMEYARPAGIGVIIYCAYAFGKTPEEQFAVLGPFIVMLMCGTIAFEGLFLGAVASEKIGYESNRQYQRQSAFYSLAIALTAAAVYVLQWGTRAEAAVTLTMLLFFAFSGSNHLYTAIKEGNTSRTNLMRPILSVVLIAYLLPMMIRALKSCAES